MGARVFVLVCSLVFAAPLTALAAPAASTQTADDKRAAKAFTEGQQAFEAGDFRRAAGLFEQAYAAKPHHSALWNAARSWQRAGEDLTAVNLLERYLHDAPTDAPNRAEANAALAAITKRVGRIQIQIVYVQDPKLDNAPAKEGLAYVAPGEHVLTATANDGASPIRRVVSVKAGEIVSVTLEPPKETPPPPPPPVVIVKKGISPWFVVGGGVLTAAAGGLTVVFGLNTVKNRDAFLANKTQANLDAGNDAQLRTNIALGATIGLAVLTTAIAVFLVDWGSSSSKTAAKAPTFASDWVWR
ncbi:MAG: tetratricopeptide repeat protein [Labilithrix sp.]|nr:tetratricopeptide repeat protein [Labilithrix sp.]MCW5817108.1 tetratricopeptide repeat protein [Labilithrix sp.]